MKQQEYMEKVYAGVLGKIIGVFHGRPVEGWPYEKIRSTFGIVDRYVYKEADTPLIVADDDIAGTFTFLNAVEDCENIRKLKAKDFGNMWLDYIIEDKTIFWWGGLGRSTEHTAFLRLKAGMEAPDSGSVSTNGAAVAEQIGAQIFMDGLAMMCPCDPQMARYLTEQSARVSHDGIAVEAACMLAGMEAMAFGEKSTERLIEESFRLGMSDRLKKIVLSVAEECVIRKDFREVRDWLEDHYGYSLYPGNCHVVPNFALILSCLFLGGDDFAKGMNDCVSAGWDTDCNAANLGCLNGIRLGLSSITERYDYRSPLADRLYNISSEGGNCVSNAERETHRITALKSRLYGEKPHKQEKQFLFSLPGSVQGFCGCPFIGNRNEAALNGNQLGLENGIFLKAGRGRDAFSTPVMWEEKDRQPNYCLTGSPLLYEGQTVNAEFLCLRGNPRVRLYIVSYDRSNTAAVTYGRYKELGAEGARVTVSFKLPAAGGRTIARVGAQLTDQETNGEALLCSLDWKGAPEHFEIKGSLRNYGVNGPNRIMEAFVSSARQYSFDSTVTFTISHTEKNGVVTTGTGDWKNYSVSSRLIPGLLDRFGIVGRCRGHRRYYGLVFWDNKKAAVIKRKGSEERLLAVADCIYENDIGMDVCLTFYKDKIKAAVNGAVLLEAEDGEYTQGGAGYMVDCGTVMADGFCVEARVCR